MKRFSAILLLLAVAALGSGALRYAHEMAHDAAHAKAAADHGHGHESEGGGPDGGGHEHPSAPAHDESTCFTHAQLKLPMLAAGIGPALVCVGCSVSPPAARAAPVLCRRPVLLLDSRGPPVG